MSPKSRGQHFLTNRNIGRKMIQLIQPGNKPIMEIGAGKGILSELLLEFYPGNEIILVEIDRGLFRHLHERFGHKCQVLNADILDIKLDKLTVQGRINLVGNIPYCISKELIDWTIGESGCIEKGVFMMQKAFVNKLRQSPDSKKKNAQSMIFKFLYLSKKIMDIHPGSFSPPPRVVSTIFTFQENPLQTQTLNIPDFYGFLKICFASRRKTLLNNLIPVYGIEEIKNIFDLHRLKTSKRSEQLDLPDFIRLYSDIIRKKYAASNQNRIFPSLN